MTPETRLHRLREDLLPEEGQKDRIRARIQQRISHAPMLQEAKQQAAPSDDVRHSLWNTVLKSIDAPSANVFDRIRDMFHPSEERRFTLRMQLMERLTPAYQPSSYRWTKLTAAFVLVLLALQLSPALFLAPRTIAESAVIVVPTKGSPELSLHDLWQPVTSEVTLKEPVQLRTGDAEASVLLHDDGMIRLDASTVVSIHDLSDRPEPVLDGPTVTLTKGRVWVQGLLPRHLRGIIVSTPYGDVTVHDGNVSIAVEEELTIRVWSRQAIVSQGGTSTVLVGGEKARFGHDTVGQVTRIADEEYTDPWVKQNLERDAVHQREIAQMQSERKAAQAGILPTSPLYSVKRAVEKVDVLLTLDPEQKVQKQLEQASTRLNEAAALIAEGSSGSEIPLEEYKLALITVASGSGASGVTQFLLRQEIAENTAEVSAAKPDDALYALKKTILEASAALPGDVVDESDVEGMVLVDTLDVLHSAIESGDTERARQAYETIQPHLSSLTGSNALKPDVQKEVLQLLSDAAEKLQESDASGSGMIATSLERDLRPYLPVQKPAEPVAEPLTDAQIDVIIMRMIQRVTVFDQPRSQRNQLVVELKKIAGHQDEGRILRRLYHEVSDDANLIIYVRRAIQHLREQNLWEE